MFKHLLVFSLTMLAYVLCQSYADSPFYQGASPNFPITIHVQASWNDFVCARDHPCSVQQYLTVSVDNRSLELIALENPKSLLKPGNYSGRITKDKSPGNYESHRVYELLLPDGKTRSFEVVRDWLTFDVKSGEYKRWLYEDVLWIITPEEKLAFIKLSNDEERDEFIRQFWVMRNPDQDSMENKFEEEHYRRLDFVDSHFAAREEHGWKTDRGRVYIIFGQPDSINSHPASGDVVKKPFEVWHYRSIRVEWPQDRESAAIRRAVPAAIVDNFDFKFVDECACGQYRLESPWPSADSTTPASDPAPAESPH